MTEATITMTQKAGGPARGDAAVGQPDATAARGGTAARAERAAGQALIGSIPPLPQRPVRKPALHVYLKVCVALDDPDARVPDVPHDTSVFLGVEIIEPLMYQKFIHGRDRGLSLQRRQ